VRQLEPPPGYVAFVRRQLDPLRRDAAGVVGDERDADLLYPDVLTDVAARWQWLELLRTLGRPGAADTCLHRAFARRSQRWRADRAEQTIDIEVFGLDVLPLPSQKPRPTWSNAATRLATFVRPNPGFDAAPVAEAAVAWWHAYEARRRRRITAGVVVALMLMVWAAQGLPLT
jgi:hypothetical protein